MQKKEDALKGVKLFVLDMDGTVYLGNHMIDGALDFIHEVDASEDRDYIFFTNNASRVPSVYVEKLHKLLPFLQLKVFLKEVQGLFLNTYLYLEHYDE